MCLLFSCLILSICLILSSGVYCYYYAPGAGRDLILPTQRIWDIKICMVGICKVKVRFAYLALAHVSHFFRTGVVGLQAIDAFFTFWTFWNFTVASSASVFASPCRTFFRTSAVGPQAIVAFYSFCNFWKFIFVSCAPAFGPRVAHVIKKMLRMRRKAGQWATRGPKAGARLTKMNFQKLQKL